MLPSFIKRHYLAMSFVQRIAISTTALTIFTAVFMSALISIEAVATISDLELEAAVKEVDVFEEHIEEKVLDVKILTNSISKRYFQLHNEQRNFETIYNQQDTYVLDAIAQFRSDTVKEMLGFLKSYPFIRSLKIYKTIGLDDDLVAEDIIVTRDRGPILAVPERHLQLVRKTPLIKQIIDGPIATASVSSLYTDKAGHRDDAMIGIKAGYSFVSASDGGARTIIIIDLDMTAFFKRITSGAGPFRDISIWVKDNVSPKYIQIAFDGAGSFSYYHNQDETAYVSEHENMKYISRDVLDAAVNTVMSITYGYSTDAFFSHGQSFLIVTFFTLAICSIFAILAGMVVARPVANMVQSVNDLAYNRINIHDLEKTASSKDEMSLAAAVITMRNRFEERSTSVRLEVERYDAASKIMGVGIWGAVRGDDYKEYYNVVLTDALKAKADTDKLKLRNFLHPDDLVAFDTAIETAVNGFNINLRILIDQNEYRIFRFKGRGVSDREDGSVKITGVLIDLEEQNKNIRRRKAFLSKIYADVLSSLSSLSATSRVFESRILGQDTDSPYAQTFDVIEQHTDTALKDVKGLQDFALAQAKILPLSLMPTRLSGVLETVSKKCEDMCLAKNTKLDLMLSVKNTILNLDQERFTDALYVFLADIIEKCPNDLKIDVSLKIISAKVAQINVKRPTMSGLSEFEINLPDGVYHLTPDDTLEICMAQLNPCLAHEIIRLHGGVIGLNKVGKQITYFIEFPVPVSADIH